MSNPFSTVRVKYNIDKGSWEVVTRADVSEEHEEYLGTYDGKEEARTNGKKLARRIKPSKLRVERKNKTVADESTYE